LLENKGVLINAGLHLKTAEKLISAVSNGVSISDDDGARQLADKLRQNIYSFSAAKSFTQMMYYRDMMIGDDGHILPVGSFIKKIADTGEIFNKKFLTTEYENAHYSAIMASNWESFQDDDLLQYSTVGDSNVRPSHAAMDKYTAPKSAAFWRVNYPPNGWNCRCSVVPGKGHEINKLTEAEAVRQLTAENKDTPFYNNVGISKVIFKDNHPYFINSSGKETDLSWEQYGMNNIAKIRAEALAPYVTASLEEYVKWWNQQDKIKNSESIGFLDMFGSRIVMKKGSAKNGIYQHAKNVEFIITHPDEVWIKPSDKTRKVYLKYFEDETIKITVNNINQIEAIITIKKGEASEVKKLNEARKGVLMYR